MAKKSTLEKTIDKQKKAHPVAFLLVILFLIAGALTGYFTVKYLTKDDTFELLGESTIVLTLGENYKDEGAKAISFGRDISDKIKTENNIDNSVEGVYYIKYTVDDIRYNGVVKYRYIMYFAEIPDGVLDDEKTPDGTDGTPSDESPTEDVGGDLNDGSENLEDDNQNGEETSNFNENLEEVGEEITASVLNDNEMTDVLSLNGNEILSIDKLKDTETLLGTKSINSLEVENG